MTSLSEKAFITKRNLTLVTNGALRGMEGWMAWETKLLIKKPSDQLRKMPQSPRGSIVTTSCSYRVKP